jgi:hypothetical protein
MNISFAGGQESCANPNADSSEAKGGGGTSSIRNASARQHRQGRNRIDHLWNQSHGPQIAANVAACFTSLSDNQIETGVSSTFGFIDGAHDLYRNGIRRLYATQMRAPIAPEEGYDAYTIVQRDPELLIDREIEHEVSAEWPLSQRPHSAEQVSKLIGTAPCTREVA